MASVSDPESDVFVVDRILYKGVNNRKTMYLVKLMGYDNTENTWEPSSNMQNRKELVKIFNKLFKQFGLPVQQLTAADVANPQIATLHNNHLMDRAVVKAQLWGLVNQGYRAGMISGDLVVAVVRALPQPRVPVLVATHVIDHVLAPGAAAVNIAGIQEQVPHR
ncbi:hypothetical protein DAPPUDRAFT_332551 [Daphnia pulex]|uniref:Chromo domain-containing protein n=1 Tax=Daphnia pulex TaxID=6669 RepID=E9HQ97_DAPPU|nr:hypothetical protein DAPPUDRAFT_332551 [Daphnia pulex]|eukprot:EFX66086.1 hypothetical protein DAPPUDRAFT_332551 [Daphnia pulex]